jgi:hypothetical protein
VNQIIGSQTPKQICRCCVFSAVMLCSGLASYAQSPATPPASSAISVQTDLVVLPVTVTDSQGNAVLGLTEQDFRVYEDGRLQKIALFQQGPQPQHGPAAAGGSRRGFFFRAIGQSSR